MRKKMPFLLAVLFVLFGALSADIGVCLFAGIAQGAEEPLTRGVAVPILAKCGIATQEQLLVVFCVMLLITGALLAGSVACAAARTLQSKMARDEETEKN